MAVLIYGGVDGQNVSKIIIIASRREQDYGERNELTSRRYASPEPKTKNGLMMIDPKAIPRIGENKGRKSLDPLVNRRKNLANQSCDSRHLTFKLSHRIVSRSHSLFLVSFLANYAIMTW